MLVGRSLSPFSWGVGVNFESLDSFPKHLDRTTVQALDALIDRTIAAAPNGHFQIWVYAQVERGRVAQVGISPVVGESVRFPDGGRRR